MVKKIIIIGFISLAIASNLYANDGDRIDRMEKEIQELNHRLSTLESLLGNQNAAQEIVTSGEGWKLVANWRKITTDMGYDEVRKLLGEPDRVKGGNIAFWFYPNGADVTFHRGKVHSWTEP